ncbi:MAG: tRNA epoxyqueuosine(34) reductase QueG [Gammaproteobacteria bacterium]|nr:tRNA epoxyqueuosine(34) reductase QueG [Gammaproteobacteria bacterium]
MQAQLPDKQTLEKWAQALGFQAIGITDVDLCAHEPHVRDWLRQGFAGSMGYLHRNLEKRLHPDLLEPGTCRVISARMNYLYADTQPIEVLNQADLGYISRYALGRDYHKVLRKRLAKLAAKINATLPNHRYRAFTDSAPVLEKALAEKSALGWMGKHSLILHKQAGSWFFLGEIYTNAPLALDPDPDQAQNEAPQDHCGNCRACMTVCPTQAILSPKTIDARKCISYLTIEHKGSIPIDLRPAMGNRIYGCDDCQLFCPWNRTAPTTTLDDFKPRHGLEAPRLLDLFNLSEVQFLNLTEGSAMRRVNFEQWSRNLAIAIGNGASSPAAISALKHRKQTASTMVAEHITWALERLT